MALVVLRCAFLMVAAGLGATLAASLATTVSAGPDGLPEWLPWVVFGGVMIIAILKVHHGSFLLRTNGFEYCLNLLAMSIMILCAGGGRFGIGGWIRQQLEKRKKSGGKPKPA